MPRVKDTLKQLAVQPSKRRGQNFVIDKAVIEKMLSFANLRADENVIEIGPGLGALTAELVKSRTLTVIEIEEQFCADLKRRFPELTVIHADARSVNYSEFNNGTIIGNLPYAASTDIVTAVVQAAPNLKRAIFMLQREFAERMAAGPGTRDYGTLSVFCSLWSSMDLGPIIPGTAFHPPTAVESRLIEMQFLKQPRVECPDQAWLRRVVKSCFHSRRRTLQNSLVASGLGTRESVSNVLALCSIDPKRRAETLSVEDFGRLAQEFWRLRKST